MFHFLSLFFSLFLYLESLVTFLYFFYRTIYIITLHLPGNLLRYKPNQKNEDHQHSIFEQQYN